MFVDWEEVGEEGEEGGGGIIAAFSGQGGENFHGFGE